MAVIELGPEGHSVCTGHRAHVVREKGLFIQLARCRWKVLVAACRQLHQLDHTIVHGECAAHGQVAYTGKHAQRTVWMPGVGYVRSKEQTRSGSLSAFEQSVYHQLCTLVVSLVKYKINQDGINVNCKGMCTWKDLKKRKGTMRKARRRWERERWERLVVMLPSCPSCRSSYRPSSALPRAPECRHSAGAAAQPPSRRCARRDGPACQSCGPAAGLA